MKFFLLDQKLYKISAVKVKQVLSSHDVNSPIYLSRGKGPTFPMKTQRYWPDLIGAEGNSVFMKVGMLFFDFLNI